MTIRLRLLAWLLSCLASTGLLSAADLTTPLIRDDLDPAAFSEWVAGRSAPIPPERLKEGPAGVVWTRNSQPNWTGVEFGASSMAGVRHLRIGFTRALGVGTVVACAGGLSVLKPGAAYPGDPGDDSQWLVAERQSGSALSTAAEIKDYAIWVLPPGTVTRALRFTHTAATVDQRYAGKVMGVWLLAERFANVAPAAAASSGGAGRTADRLNDQRDNDWGTWDNGEHGQEQPVSPEHPAWVMLAWAKPQAIAGLVGLTVGASAIEAQVCTGPADLHPAQADETQWRTVVPATPTDPGYPKALVPAALSFPAVETTRGVRLRFLATIDGAHAHPHLRDKTHDGKRVWLGELLAFSALGSEPLAPLPSAAPPTEHPPIAVPFTIAQPGLVTLVIDGADGKRVRNLVAETPFPAGANVAWWDGMDDLGRDVEAARHGLYHVPGQFVAPGTYTVRGLTLKPLDLRFEFSLYNAGDPAWTTRDGPGGWTTNHTPPRSVIAVPAARSRSGAAMLYIGSYVAEGGHGLIWVDEQGRKQGGEGWLGGGGAWTGAQWLARDAGAKADAKTVAYAGASWEKELRLIRLTSGEDRPLLKPVISRPDAVKLAGLAVHDGLIVCSLSSHGELLFVDAGGSDGKDAKELGSAELTGCGSVGFDPQGRLLAIVGKQLVRFTLTARPSGRTILPAPQVVVKDLEDPQQFTCDDNGDLYIADRGASHQIKVFGADGTPRRTIGRAGAPKAGAYDPGHLNNPCGVAIDGLRQLWVAEEDFQPKRVSVWSLDGKLLRAFYGPSGYGGGGTLDPQDKTRFTLGGMVFRADWKAGTDQLETVLFRSESLAGIPSGGQADGMPEMPHQAGGRRWYSNWHNSSPTNGASLVAIWRELGGVAVAAAGLGDAQNWALLKDERFRARWPVGTDAKGDRWRNRAFFVWSDANGDGQAQPEEVTMTASSSGGVVILPDLTAVVTRVGGKTMRFKPQLSGDRLGYDLAAGEVLASGVEDPRSSGGDQAWPLPDGWTVLSLGVAPYSPYSLTGVLKGEPRWTYPNLWPGLHASHEAPVPEFPGELIGVTRLLGGPVTPRGSDAGPILAFNGNMGPMFLLTADGLFVATLFKDVRTGKPWSMPVAERGMLLNDVAPHDENFWPSITQTADGLVYVQDGARSSLVRVDNLESLRRLPPTQLVVSEADLAKAREVQTRNELARQQAMGNGTLKVGVGTQKLVVDGKLDDWQGAEWATVDLRGTAANFNSDSKPYSVHAAAGVAGDRLHLVWRTTEKELLRNSGENAVAPFKTGGCLDLMLGTDPDADPRRTEAVAGDLRLLVTRVKDQTRAMLYRAVVPGTAKPVPFSSPSRTITLDRVDDISAQVEFAASDGVFEVAVPLAVLAWQPRPGTTVKADLGILRGDGANTLQRVYWSNKGTAIVSDVPSEAQLTPALWGRWEIVAR
ncbi:MAG: hypothetical protein H0X38_02410 [Planctomycetes bacterium]|nr:hypothetical protein [Planctomycetota bacterium]